MLLRGISQGPWHSEKVVFYRKTGHVFTSLLRMAALQDTNCILARQAEPCPLSWVLSIAAWCNFCPAKGGRNVKNKPFLKIWGTSGN